MPQIYLPFLKILLPSLKSLSSYLVHSKPLPPANPFHTKQAEGTLRKQIRSHSSHMQNLWMVFQAFRGNLISLPWPIKTSPIQSLLTIAPTTLSLLTKLQPLESFHAEFIPSLGLCTHCSFLLLLYSLLPFFARPTPSHLVLILSVILPRDIFCFLILN